MPTQFHDRELDAASLEQLFLEARTYSRWLDKDIDEAQITRIYDLLKMAPTSANQQPARFVWCRSRQAKQSLADCAAEGNKDKILNAPVTVIIGYDLDFHEQLPWLYPHTDARSWFTGDEAGRKQSAFRNSVLQGAYLIMAARAVGLDCGPMSGFDAEAATRAFFSNQPRYRADWMCSIGYGDTSTLHDRSPRPDFDTFNRIA